MKCGTCQGSGGNAPTCHVCSGQGFVEKMVGNSFFRQLQREQCHQCNGRGKIVVNACKTCSGKGILVRQHFSILLFTLMGWVRTNPPGKSSIVKYPLCPQVFHGFVVAD